MSEVLPTAGSPTRQTFNFILRTCSTIGPAARAWSPMERLKRLRAIARFMQTPRSPYDAAVRGVPPELAPLVPRSYERIGDVALLPLGELQFDTARAIAAAYGRALGVHAVARRRGIHGPWRQPDVETLWGDGLETVHVEDGIRYKLDLGAVMFSSGNLAERMRMGRAVRPGETVVDLFAGIGYFALPMAVRGHAAKVVACEVSPVACRYLEENVRRNRAWVVEPRLGDCRQVAPSGVADRVVMGYLDGEAYLE